MNPEPKTKKTLIIAAAAVAIVAVVWLVAFRPKRTIAGVVGKMKFLSKEQKETLRKAAETQKQVMETTNESAVAVWVKMYREERYYTKAMALVALASANLVTVGTFDEATDAQIITQLNNMI